MLSSSIFYSKVPKLLLNSRSHNEFKILWSLWKGILISLLPIPLFFFYIAFPSQHIESQISGFLITTCKHTFILLSECFFTSLTHVCICIFFSTFFKKRMIDLSCGWHKCSLKLHNQNIWATEPTNLLSKQVPFQWG